MTSAATNNDVTLTILRDTAARLDEARRGYEDAAGQVASGHLRALFRYNAEMRSEFLAALADARAKLGDDRPARFESGSTHAFWDGLREFLGGGDEARLLEACERWEEAVIDDYEIALAETTLPDDVGRLLKAQKKRIEAEVENLRELKTQFIGTRDRAAMD